MENKDIVISKALEQIEEKKKSLDNLKPVENYSFKTNCRFNELNIKTLSIPQLVKCLMEVYNKETSMNSVINDCSFLNLDDYKDAFKLYNFEICEWKEDIIYLIKKLNYNNAIKKLENGGKQLETFYSKDKQDEIAINNLLSSLNL